MPSVSAKRMLHRMKHLLLGSVTILALTAGCASTHPTGPHTPRFEGAAFQQVDGRIEVAVSGIPSVDGQLFVELYDEATFFHYEQVLAERIVPVTGTSMRVTLEHVPPGRYLVAVSHDANANHTMDTGLFGIPKEAYGFSRGARGTFGLPSFDRGAFMFDGRSAAVAVAIR